MLWSTWWPVSSSRDQPLHRLLGQEALAGRAVRQGCMLWQGECMWMYVAVQLLCWLIWWEYLQGTPHSLYDAAHGPMSGWKDGHTMLKIVASRGPRGTPYGCLLANQMDAKAWSLCR